MLASLYAAGICLGMLFASKRCFGSTCALDRHRGRVRQQSGLLRTYVRLPRRIRRRNQAPIGPHVNSVADESKSVDGQHRLSGTDRRLGRTRREHGARRYVRCSQISLLGCM
jgi:hypothetical protein